MAALVALLLTTTAGAALAAIPTTTDHRNATMPMITGTAMLVNEHQILINTEQGEEVLLSLDSRTMVPADLATGMMMRVEFKYLEDGSRLAERVIPIRGGQKTTRELAYSNERVNQEEEAELASTNPMPERYETRASNAASVTNQPLGTPLRPVPSTEAYIVATQPMLAGRVATVNDHKIVLDTDQGHAVAVEMDSRTLIPTDLQSGMGVRVEYKTLEDGTKLATRVTPLRDYEGGGEREMSMEETGESQTMVASNVENSSTSTVAENENENKAGENATTPENEAGEKEHRLPQTASQQPLIGLLGLMALGAAGLLAARRFRAS